MSTQSLFTWISRTTALWFVLSALGFQGAHAAQQKALRITADNGENGSLFLVTDDAGRLRGLRVAADDGSSKSYSLSQIQQGATLLERSGREVMTATGAGLSAEAGGALELSYLRNALSGDWRALPLRVVRSPAGRWEVEAKVGSSFVAIQELALETGSFGILAVRPVRTSGSLEQEPPQMNLAGLDESPSILARISDMSTDSLDGICEAETLIDLRQAVSSAMAR